MGTEEIKPTDIYATLKRGRVYFLKKKEFLYNVPVKVTAEEQEWLEKNAVDLVSVEDEQTHQVWPKFKFSATAETEVAPRARTRRS